MEPSTIKKTNQPRAGLRRPNYGPMHKVQRRPPTPYVKRRTVVDEHLHLLEAFHHTHISSLNQYESRSIRGGSGPGSGNSPDERDADAENVASTHRMAHERNISTRTSARIDPPEAHDLQGSQPEDSFWVVRLLPYCVKKLYGFLCPVGANTFSG